MSEYIHNIHTQTHTHTYITFQQQKKFEKNLAKTCFVYNYRVTSCKIILIQSINSIIIFKKYIYFNNFQPAIIYVRSQVEKNIFWFEWLL